MGGTGSMNSDAIRDKRRQNLRERAESKSICKSCRFCGKHCECRPKTFPDGTLMGLCGACIGGEGYRDGYDRWGVRNGPAVPLPEFRSAPSLLNGSGFRELYDAAVAISKRYINDIAAGSEPWTRFQAAIAACTDTAAGKPQCHFEPGTNPYWCRLCGAHEANKVHAATDRR